MAEISEMTSIDPTAEIGSDVSIGPFCVIGPHVRIGDGCRLISGVTIEGHTHIGPENLMYPNVTVGVAPQDMKYRGGDTRTHLGQGNVLRENVTVHRGTELGAGETHIGDHNLFMVGAHIAHDCRIGSETIIGNQTQLAGHVQVGDGAVISALVGLHHFVRVGAYSYVGGMTPVRRDVPPYLKLDGDPNRVRAVNEEGLKRKGFSAEDIDSLKAAFKRLFRRSQQNLQGELERMLAEGDRLSEPVRTLCEFLLESCKGRYGRFEELHRRDRPGDRHHVPMDIQHHEQE